MEYRQPIFALENFQGPLDLLLQLVNKAELDICDISLHALTAQFIPLLEEACQSLDRGTDFITATAYLLWLKSKILLPLDPVPEATNFNGDEDPEFEVIHQLLDYCRLRDAAKELTKREEQQKNYYTRGNDAPPAPVRKKLGVEHLSLLDLAALFNEVAARAPSPQTRRELHEEPWKVADKIAIIRLLISEDEQLPFELLFSTGTSRPELIVIFLALLELMKLGTIAIVRQLDREGVVIMRQPLLV
jgi:segregation and condensation protein A